MDNTQQSNKKEYMVELSMVISVNASNEEEAKRFIDRELNADRDNKLNDYLYGYEVKKVSEGKEYQYGGGYAKPTKKKLFNIRPKTKKNNIFPY